MVSLLEYNPRSLDVLQSDWLVYIRDVYVYIQIYDSTSETT